MVELPTIKTQWTDRAIVAATGPSLTEEVAELCRGEHVVAVSDAYRLIPWADALYSCDAEWWWVHGGCSDFAGERWSTHMMPGDDKLPSAEKYGLNLIQGQRSDIFSTDPARLSYGPCSGFQAINLAILKGARRIILVGFDMCVRSKRHFFGDHPKPLKNETPFIHFIPSFREAARNMPPGVEVINCTPASRLDCWPMMGLADALAH